MKLISNNHRTNKLAQIPRIRTFQQRQFINIPPLHRLAIYLLTISMILMTMVFNLFWKESLYWQGINIIHQIQTSPFLSLQINRIVNNIFSMFGNPLVVSVILFVQLCLVKHKFKSIIHVSFFLLVLYVVAFLKQAYQQSRPVWSTNQIQKWEWFCPKDFGNPSGHSFIIFPLYEPIVSKYIGFQNFKSAWLLLIIFGFFIPFSRTYLGMHSVNQVLFGLTLGIGATVMYRYALREWFYVTYSRVFKLKKIKYLFTAVFVHILCLGLPILFFELYSDNRPVQQRDLINLNKVCSQLGKQDDITSLLIQQSMLVKCTFESFIFGIIYGLYFLNITDMKNIGREKLYFSGRWKYNSKKSAFQHIFTIILLSSLIIMIFIFLLPKLVQTSFFHYISYTLGSTFTGFTIIFFIPKIQRIFQWIDYEEQNLVHALPLQQQEIQKHDLQRDDVSQYFG